METLKFKTNIKCSGCIAKVTPVLNNTAGIISWKVDTLDPDKILTVQVEGINHENIIKAVAKAGYQAEKV